MPEIVPNSVYRVKNDDDDYDDDDDDDDDKHYPYIFLEQWKFGEMKKKEKKITPSFHSYWFIKGQTFLILCGSLSICSWFRATVTA